MENKIICIGREYGSGGREIGEITDRSEEHTSEPSHEIPSRMPSSA